LTLRARARAAVWPGDDRVDDSLISGERGASGPIVVAIVTTLVAGALSYGLPDAHAATGVGLCFLIAVYALVLHRGDTDTVESYGLGLGGLFAPEPIEPRRLLVAAVRALAGAAAMVLLVFPAFWAGYVVWYRPSTAFSPAPWPVLLGDVPGQVLGVAFPEEAFYRGYLQSALDRAWPPQRTILGAPLGAGIVVSSALFAAGHFLTEPVPARLAVFFPSLVFGYLRARTGGIGAPLAFHAACNLFASYLGRSYGLFR
jgi:membrane protease YdiL (CAAX protease family)